MEVRAAIGLPRSALAPKELALVFIAFAALALALYSRSLAGEFLSDDLGYIVTNPWVQSLTLENTQAILDPFGAPAAYTANWAPVHLLVHALEWKLFGAQTLGWRIVNVLAHALISTLLVSVFLRAGATRAAALLAALVFLVHPANVEVVAWISQLKTILCLGFGTGAVLLHPRRPALAALLFALGILSKTTAVFALPVAVLLALRRERDPDTEPRRIGWLVVWGLVFAAYALPQLLAFERLGEAQGAIVPASAADRFRTMVAIAARYLVMAATSYGVATFQEPPAPRSWLDPWFVAGVAAGMPLAVHASRAVVTRRAEGAFWLWAAAAYAPVSQIFPFLYPMADRYLYVVLPGLAGVACLVAARVPSKGAVRWVSLVAGISLAAFFSVRTFERSLVFRSNLSTQVDSARAWPEGIAGSFLSARRAAASGDVDGVVVLIRRAADAGFDGWSQLDGDPGFAGVRNDPRFRALVHEVAGRWIAIARSRGASTRLELRALARAHAVRSEWPEAVDALERAKAVGGAADAEVAAELARARRALGDDPERSEGAAPR
jgi:hypothetical protein